MSLTQSSLIVSAGWTQSVATTNFGNTSQGPDNLSFSVQPSITTYSEVLIASYTIAPAGNQAIDFRTFTNLLGGSVTGTKIAGLLLKGTGNGAQMKIEDGGSNPLTWFLTGTTPGLLLRCGTSGCVFGIFDGTPYTVDGTHKTLKISNPGSVDLALQVWGLVGTG